MSFDPRIQIQASLVKRSYLDVTVAPYELKEPLVVRIGLRKQWRRLAQDGFYACEVLLQLVLATASGNQVAIAETVLEQIAHVQGFAGQDLADVVEVQLPAIALPYARAQIAALLLHSGYHYVTLPAKLPGEEQRAEEQVQAVDDKISEVSP